MKSYISLVFLILALAIPAAAPAQTETPKGARRVTGAIVAIDRAARTLAIKDGRTGAVVTTHVPVGRMIFLRDSANPAGYPTSIPFELTIRGLVVDLLVVSAPPAR
jgi:hypothetical protein